MVLSGLQFVDLLLTEPNVNMAFQREVGDTVLMMLVTPNGRSSIDISDDLSESLQVTILHNLGLFDLITRLGLDKSEEEE